jgi:hypothetical protein
MALRGHLCPLACNGRRDKADIRADFIAICVRHGLKQPGEAALVSSSTPVMHRVHHSVLRTEHDQNYGFDLSLWDHLFRTYLAEPRAGQQGMNIIGLTPHQSEAPTRFGWSLWLPFGPRRRAAEEPDAARRSSSGSGAGTVPRNGPRRAPARVRN